MCSSNCGFRRGECPKERPVRVGAGDSTRGLTEAASMQL
jgi:hypothetical protein